MWEQESGMIKEVTLPLNGSREVAGVLPARQKQKICLKSGTKGQLQQLVPVNHCMLMTFYCFFI